MQKERINTFIEEMLKDLKSIESAYRTDKKGTIEMLNNPDQSFTDEQFYLAFTDPNARKYFMNQILIDPEHDIGHNIDNLTGKLNATKITLKYWRETNVSYNKKVFSRILDTFNLTPNVYKDMIEKYTRVLPAHKILIEFSNDMLHDINQIIAEYEKDQTATISKLKKTENLFSADNFSTIFRNDSARRDLLHQFILKNVTDTQLDMNSIRRLKSSFQEIISTLEKINEENLNTPQAQLKIKNRVTYLLKKFDQNSKSLSNKKLIDGLPGSISKFNYEHHEFMKTVPPPLPPKPEKLKESVRKYKEAINKTEQAQHTTTEDVQHEEKKVEKTSETKKRSHTERAAHKIAKKTRKGEGEDTRSMAKRALHKVAKRVQETAKKLTEHGLFKTRTSKKTQSKEAGKTPSKGGPKK